MLLSTIHCVTISVTNGASEGRWGAKESCPAGSKAIAYDTANDFSDVPRIDKTALNSIRLHCNDPEGSTITSSIGEYRLISVYLFHSFNSTVVCTFHFLGKLRHSDCDTSVQQELS